MKTTAVSRVPSWDIWIHQSQVQPSYCLWFCGLGSSLTDAVTNLFLIQASHSQLEPAFCFPQAQLQGSGLLSFRICPVTQFAPLKHCTAWKNGLNYIFPLLALPAPLGQNPVRTGWSAVLLVATAPAAAQWVVNNKRVNICVCAGTSANCHSSTGREECFSVQSCVAVEKDRALLASWQEGLSHRTRRRLTIQWKLYP